MEAQKIILHVGPHKTGSTAIQKALTLGRDRLAENGVLYPKTGFSDFGHHQLVDAARGWIRDFDTDALREEMSGYRQVIISTENAVHLPLDKLTVLREMFDQNSNVMVVYYLRRYPDLWASHWQELIKHGETLTFYEYLCRASGVLPSSHRIVPNQFDQLSRLAQVFGRENITIIGYDHLRGAGVDFAEYFLEKTLGSAMDGFATGRVNESAPAWHIELVRQLNAIYRNNTGKIASYKLRMKVFHDLRGATIPFADEFSEVYGSISVPCSISNDSLPVVTLQSEVLNFEDRILEASSAVPSFRSSSTKTVSVFDMPAFGLERLKGALVEYYRENVTEW
ncbi:hypothetical protein [Henriciella pelagia]|uniref:hypothetical protein n=1 Tax=Henriciella pelagia TaxID=1977912 RepID=UPI0035164ECB